jgi:putative component of membrane protein insertase Oxa1/YidC/SpoIIIJ protein YidD
VLIVDIWSVTTMSVMFLHCAHFPACSRVLVDCSMNHASLSCVLLVHIFSTLIVIYKDN